MEFLESVKDLAKRVKVARDTAQTEEATKTSVVLPFIRALGFDVFDLDEVVPEFIADVGVKKGEKVDFALKIDGEIVMLIECKPIATDLSKSQFTQLYRYFSVTEARVSILTNGREIWFFSDIDERNRMDSRPFFRFDLEAFDDHDVKELAKFQKQLFSVDGILETASSLKYTTAAATYLKSQMESPDDEFLKLVGRQIYDGMLTKSVLDQLRSPVKSALAQIVRDRIEDRLNIALFGNDEAVTQPEGGPDKASDIVTTEEEIQAFHIVQAIAAKEIDLHRVTIRDSKTYCSVFVDDNNRKPVARFYFNSKSVKYLGLFDDQKSETKVQIADSSDILKHENELLEAVRAYA